MEIYFIGTKYFGGTDELASRFRKALRFRPKKISRHKSISPYKSNNLFIIYLCTSFLTFSTIGATVSEKKKQKKKKHNYAGNVLLGAPFQNVVSCINM